MSVPSERKARAVKHMRVTFDVIWWQDADQSYDRDVGAELATGLDGGGGVLWDYTETDAATLGTLPPLSSEQSA